MRRPRLWLCLAAFAVVTAACVVVGRYEMFTGFAAYDDEGYMLIALQSFLHGGSLYGEVFSQYGPFYYELWGGVFSLLGLSVGHDVGRTVTLVVWVATGLLLGLATLRMTRSLLLAVGVQVIAFAALSVARNEPMHPGGLTSLLLAAIVMIACMASDRLAPGTMLALGAAVAALALVKINLGAFAVAALALACVVTYPALFGRRALRLLIEVGFVAIPLLLMKSKLGEPWAREYGGHVAIAALAVVIALRARNVSRPRQSEELWWIAAGFAATAAAVLLAIMGTGTGPGDLVHGVITQPLGQDNAFTIPLVMSRWLFLFDALGLAGALAFWWLARGPQRRRPAGLEAALYAAVLVVGVEIAFSLVGRLPPFDARGLAAYPLSMLAFAWVPLVPVRGETPVGAFGWLLLPPLAVLQALHAYPVAGSQLFWGTFLLVPVGALCVASGARGLAAAVEGRGRIAVRLAAAAAAAALLVFAADVGLRQPYRDFHTAYRLGTPLDLPGAESIRVGPAEADLYRRVTAAVDANCRAFVMLPGMESFYFWTRQTPPSGENATAWPTLFDDATQRRVIDDTRSIHGLCLLENQALALGWIEDKSAQGPLMRYLRRGFSPITEVGPYVLLRRGAAGT